MECILAECPKKDGGAVVEWLVMLWNLQYILMLCASQMAVSNGSHIIKGRKFNVLAIIGELACRA